MSDNLLVLAVISFAAGIGGSALLSTDIFPITYPLLLFLPVIMFFAIKNCKKHYAEILSLILFFIIGIVHAQLRNPPPTDPQAIYQQITKDREISLIGILQEAPAISAEKSSLLMAAEKIITADKAVPASGSALIRFKGYPPEDLHPGDRFMVRGHFSRPKAFAVPGSFNYPSFLSEKKIFITGRLNSRVNILKIKNSSQPGLYDKLRYSPEFIRQRINNFIITTLPPRQAGLYKAILTGDRAAVAPDILENFKAVGCFHLLAISGLHMGLLAFIIITVIYNLLKRSTWILLHTPAWKISMLAALPPLILYGFIAGFHIPVVRALIMTIILAGATLSDSRMNLATAIALAALIILIINPAALFTASFQLSFAAVIAIVAVAPLLCRKLQKITSSANLWQKTAGWTVISLLTSLIATVGTAPLSIYHFNRLSLLSPLSTLLIEPLLCFWSLVIGLVGSCLIFIEPQAAVFFFKVGAWGLNGATWTAELLARLPFSSVWFTTPGILEVFCAYAFMICLLYRPNHYPVRFAAVSLLLFLIIQPNLTRILRNRSNDCHVSVLDVGQGCAVVMELGNGRTIVLDGGGSRTMKFNVGESLLAPFLWQRRIRNIEAVIISHPDGDHFNGLPFILERFHPETLWVNGEPGNKLYKSLLRQAKKAGIKIRIPEKNCIISQQGENMVRNLTGMHKTGKYPNLNDNDRSLIIKLTTAKTAMLFPGDIEKEAEKTAVDNNYDLAADIMLAPHHGSKTSNSEIFLRTVRPKMVIISAAARKYGIFPANEVVKRYCKQNISILSTGKNGTIACRLTPQQVQVKTYASVKSDGGFLRNWTNLPFSIQLE